MDTYYQSLFKRHVCDDAKKLNRVLASTESAMRSVKFANLSILIFKLKKEGIVYQRQYWDATQILDIAASNLEVAFDYFRDAKTNKRWAKRNISLALERLNSASLLYIPTLCKNDKDDNYLLTRFKRLGIIS